MPNEFEIMDDSWVYKTKNSIESRQMDSED